MTKKIIVERGLIYRCGQCRSFKLSERASFNNRFGRCTSSKKAARPYNFVIPRCLAVDCEQFYPAVNPLWTPKNDKSFKLDF